MIRLPWVSRESHEIALNAECRRADAEHENAQDLRRQLVDLSARYHMLKLRGAVETPPPEPRAERKPDPVKQAINSVAGENRILRAQMFAQANLDRAAGVADDVIARNILAGVSGEDVFV